MSLAVLQSDEQIRESRRQMRARRVSQLKHSPAWARALLRRLGFSMQEWADDRKSWDVWKTALFLESALDRSAPVLDLGAWHSEILPVLHCMNFSDLHGMDLNPAVLHGPYSDAIRYRVGDFYRAPYPDEAFAAVTAISAIEHGLDLPRLLAEVSRILRPGGVFIASTDYWPEKIDTTGLSIFSMSWTIFSAAELEHLIASVRELHLEPVGPLAFDATRPTVHYMEREYTFAWFALQKVVRE
ncbi:hypothetical protein FTUN_8110 [Frigoriglobus tundricola]|uniref:Methyltransferase type 11 domain-containing protein n=1 Tax=Frigoriglobus tundricola TaxID=2774151 RepID=A0A6M5Z255_9BACT|nr:hypothetical protein FTUN_8110 [Frigoriglobus tundricola]